MTGKVQDAFNYSSSNPKVAKVDGNGKVTAVGKGTATISVKAYGVVAKCKVTVEVKK